MVVPGAPAAAVFAVGAAASLLATETLLELGESVQAASARQAVTINFDIYF
jgi:hypothetical protein